MANYKLDFWAAEELKNSEATGSRIVFSYHGIIKLNYRGNHYYQTRHAIIKEINALKLKALFKPCDDLDVIHIFSWDDDKYIETIQRVPDEALPGILMLREKFINARQNELGKRKQPNLPE